MVRGGRSWPSERKLGAGAESLENLTPAGSRGSNTDGTELTSGVSEQKAEHALHLSDVVWSWLVCPSSWLVAA